MDVSGFLKALRRRWRTLTVGTLLGLVAGVCVSLLTTPLYQSTTQLFISTPGSGSIASQVRESSPYRGDQFSRERATTYRALVLSKNVSDTVAANLGLNITGADLNKKVSARIVPDTVLLEISVTDASAMSARRLATAVADQAATVIRALETPRGMVIPTVEPVIIEPAELPSTPIEPDKLRNLLLGGALGLLVGATAAVVPQTLANRVTGIGDLNSISNVPALATFPHSAMSPRAPIESLDELGSEIADSGRSLRLAVESVIRPRGSVTLLVASPRQAEGKSTVAVALAFALAEARRSVVLVDANLRNPAIHNLVSVPDKDSQPALTDSASRHRKLVSELPEVGGVAVLTAGESPTNPIPILESPQTAAYLEQLGERFEWVIIDSPAVLDYADTGSLVQYADSVLVVVADDETRHLDFKNGLAALSLVNAPVVGCVLNQAQSQPGDTGSTRRSSRQSKSIITGKAIG